MDISFKKRGSASDSGRTIVCYILDESSSMTMNVDSVISGFNEYVSTLQAEEEGEILFCFTKFNTQAEVVYACDPIGDVQELSKRGYTPNGMTALLDAVGMSINAIDKIVNEGDNVLVAIMTDGEENSSREFNNQAIRSLISKRKKDNWEFAFMGAGESTWNTAQSFGISKGNTIIFANNPAAHSHTINTFARATSHYHTANLAGSYTNDAFFASADDSKIKADATLTTSKKTKSKS